MTTILLTEEALVIFFLESKMSQDLKLSGFEDYLFQTKQKLTNSTSNSFEITQ